MISEKIKYVDYDGTEREETCYFNFNKDELMELEMSKDGGLGKWLRKIVESKQTSQVQKYYKKFILSAYGEKSNDGREFRKYDDDGRPLWRKFESTGAFHELYYKLMTDEDYAIKFINGIIGVNTETPQIPADSKVITTNFNS